MQFQFKHYNFECRYITAPGDVNAINAKFGLRIVEFNDVYVHRNLTEKIKARER
jgi:hypothetical protein